MESLCPTTEHKKIRSMQEYLHEKARLRMISSSRLTILLAIETFMKGKESKY